MQPKPTYSAAQGGPTDTGLGPPTSIINSENAHRYAKGANQMKTVSSIESFLFPGMPKFVLTKTNQLTAKT